VVLDGAIVTSRAPPPRCDVSRQCQHGVRRVDDQLDPQTDRMHVTSFAPPVICLIAASDHIGDDTLRVPGAEAVNL